MTQTKAQLIDGKSAEIEFAGGSASAPAISFTGDANTGIYSPGADQVAISTNGTGRLFVNSAGQVGIGTSPSASFHVAGTTRVGANDTTDAALEIGAGATGNRNAYIDLTGDTTYSDYALRIIRSNSGANANSSINHKGTGNFTLRTEEAGALVFSTTNTERLRITSDGKVGLGTSSPSKLLTIGNSSTANTTVRLNCSQTAGSDTGMYSFGVDDSGDFAGMRLDFTDRTTKGLQIFTASGFGYPISFSGSSGNQDVTIDTSGRVGVGTTSPARALHINAAGDHLKLTTATTGSAAGDGFDVKVNAATSQVDFLNYENSDIAFWTNVTERLRIDSSGRVGIGTSSPGYKLHISDSGDAFLNVASTGTIQSAILRLVGRQTSVDEEWNIVSTGGGLGSNALRFVRGGWTGTPSMVLDSSGRLGIGTTSPGYLLDCQSTSGHSIATGVSTNKLYFYADASNTTIGTSSASSAMRFNIGTGGAYEKARIDSSGRLLVGTSSTSSESTILVQGNNNGSTLDGTIRFARGTSSPTADSSLGKLDFGDSGHTSAARIQVLRDGGTWTSGSSQPTRLTFSTCGDGQSSPTERMRIGNNGDSYLLGNSSTLNVAHTQAAGTTFNLIYGVHSATSTTGSGTLSFVVRTNGNVQNTNNSYGAISDIKLKENIVDASSQWSDIKALRPVNYNFKEGQTHTQLGLIAQEVELVSPGLVSESPDRDAEGNDLGTVTKSVNYSVLYMKAVKALQEAMERIETLEADVAALKAQ